jgi:FtsZ-binding cell division protein ZapB
MDTEISDLEGKLEQLIGLFEAGKTEVRNLRTRVVALEAENRQLADKVRLATERLESLLARLPED